MRKIKFRGRITDTKEWVCGSLIITLMVNTTFLLLVTIIHRKWMTGA